jgi:hypothetical protein
MTLRNVIQFILMILGVGGFVLGVGTLEYLAEADFGLFALLSAIIGFVLLIIWILLVVRDNARDTKYPIVRYSPPTEPLKPVPTRRSRTAQPIYDQEADKS